MSARTDFERLESIQKAFSKAVKENYRAEYGGSAVAEFTRQLGVMEYLHIGVARLRYGFTQLDAFEYRAQRLMDYCEKAVPLLIRTFGEAALLKALPPDARNEEDAALSEKYGGSKIAALIRKTL